MKALVFDRFGGPEVLEYRDIPEPVISDGHVIVRMKAIGLNFADIYRRKGNYHLTGTPPYILGYEGAGVIEQVGAGVSGLNVGDRVAFADVPFANAELVSVPSDKAIPLPDDISFEQASAVLLQGLTAHYLVHDSYPVQAGEEVLIHAAAGGVGQLLIQLCKAKGARVFGLTSSDAKKKVALEAGADEVMLYQEDWVKAVPAWSAGFEGVHVAYDSVGSTLMDSFAAVRKRGAVVFYGMSGGDPEPVDPRMLMDTSKTLTGGDLWNHVTTREDRICRGDSLFEEIRGGRLRLGEPARYRLHEGAEAHRFLEGRKSTGKILLIP
ncbi:zinc-binding dehydrogenase [Paenibacillus sp. HJL G12]|uniref:Zinc-binding dehydrogenase n=1 Tax=Paenibacillus dendrobii TaxID=2691084 RepID=A0A7X3IHT4_9BACL|nr:quinone oxidoreductase [Paenibacillus dendrobii]MWV43736.1 zinc-binding dehydrogenase [Paenibacillus dendrobii]